MLIPYVSSPSLEVERRTADTHAGRLEPLLPDHWRYAFPALDYLWPDEVAEVGMEMAALATSLNLGGLSSGLTIEVIIALTTALKDLNAFAVGKTNAKRTAEVVRASKNASNTPPTTRRRTSLPSPSWCSRPTSSSWASRGGGVGFFPKVVGFFPIRIPVHSCASVCIFVHFIVFLKH